MRKNALTTYFIDSFEELRKVTWPTKEQTARLTIVTLVFSLVMALLLTGLDLGFNLGVRSLVNLF